MAILRFPFRQEAKSSPRSHDVISVAPGGDPWPKAEIKEQAHSWGQELDQDRWRGGQNA